ncbi:serine/threonine-protein kinase [Actinomycetes bacterium KLBMP 9797]
MSVAIGSSAGRRIGGYVLAERIGSGATGTVWRALDEGSGEQVAVKLLREELATQPKTVLRFTQEGAILTALRHPNVVRVRELLTTGGSLGLVMDLVPGGSLRDRLRDCHTVPPVEAATILAGVAAALAEAHAAGVVHRDLKPDNVLLGAPGAADPEVRLTDFGIARVLDSPGLTTTGALVGTPNYLAPEVINGDVPTTAADVYAFGVLLYELLAGRPPFAGGPSGAVLGRHLERAPRRQDGMPAALWQVIEECTAKAPERRPRAADLADRMRALAADLSGAPPPPLAAAKPVGPRHLRRARKGPFLSFSAYKGSLPRFRVVGTAVAVVACLVAGAGVLSARRDRPVAPPSAAPATSASPSATPVATAPSRAAVTRRAAPQHRAAGRTQVAEAAPRSYGPWRCAQYAWQFGHPAMAQPCQSTGPGVRLTGKLRAMEGLRVDVTMSLVDAASGRTAAGPFSCRGLTFAKRGEERTCGPFTAKPARGRYAVVQTWRYQGESRLGPGTARTAPFTYP